VIRRTKAGATGWQVRANALRAAHAALLVVFVCVLGRPSAGADLELRYYGATWCAPCHTVEPMVERWATKQPGLRIVKLDYDATKADRLRYDLVGVPMLVLLDGDKVIGKYGANAQRISDFADDRLEWWYESARGKITTAE
jgi:thiol-disulfide isomerase/thioredoxin